MRNAVRNAVVLLALVVCSCSPHKDEKHVAPLYANVSNTGSMEPTLHGGDVVFVAKRPIEKVVVGDIIDTYWDGAGLNVCHRVIDRKIVNGKVVLITKGDANTVRDVHVTTEENYIGVVFLSKRS